MTITTPNSGLTGVFNTLFTTLNISASGGTGTRSFAIDSGSLPTGLSLSSSGAITGTPSQTGNFPITIKVTDAAGASATTNSFTIGINRANQTLSFATTTYSLNFGQTQVVSATGLGTGTITYSVGSSTACSVTGSTVSITAGSGTCTISASIAQDSNYNAASSSNSVTISVSRASLGTVNVSMQSSRSIYLQLNPITVTADQAVSVTIQANGFSVPGCTSIKSAVSGASHVARCQYKPSQVGSIQITATITPVNSGYQVATRKLSLNVSLR